jgi:hypothetical protein
MTLTVRNGTVVTPAGSHRSDVVRIKALVVAGTFPAA